MPTMSLSAPSRGLRAAIFSLAMLSLSCAGVAASADSLAENGAALFAKGAFEAALDPWNRAAESYRRSGQTPALIDTLVDLGGAYQALGQHRLAVKALDEAADLAREAKDDARLASALSSLGAVNTFSRDAADAEKTLREAVAAGRRAGGGAAVAPALNNLGNLLGAQEKFASAQTAYREAIAAAGPGALAAKARANLANLEIDGGNFGKVPALNAAALEAARALSDSHEKAFTLLRVGKTWEALFENAPSHPQRRRADALRAYEMAGRSAEAAGDDRALSFALGYSGHLYEQEKKLPEALRLTTRAVFLAQKIQSPDVLYRFEWQLGRILREQGRRDEAIAAFQRAVELLKGIRTDLSTRLGNSNARSSFRERAGGAYFDLADLLLQRADDLHGDELRDGLIQARDTCEQLKTVELEDYFQDDCVNLLKKKRETIEDILQGKGTAKEKDKDGRNAALEKATRTTAVVYIIPLRDRTETLISLPGGLHRMKSRVNVAQITETVRAFREHLEKRTTSEYLAESWQLYDWLIRPLETLLEENKIDTLVFVPDGALRTIPMAALHDRAHFLVEKYAIAITPGLTLMEPRPIARTNMTVLASGLSESVQGYPALPFVEGEMSKLKELFHPDTFMNRDFGPAQLEKEFAARPYSIVHIASHGEFSGDVKKTFVLTYADHFSLDALEKLIRPSQLRDQPVEMLALSACQTAAGDDRAALGLGGIAVKAGARSAFASLWSVNDQASTKVIGDFYTALRDHQEMSKAQALRKAQLGLLKDERFSHPCLWAPYLIIGNWL